MRGRFIGYRGGQRTQYNKYVLIQMNGVDDRGEAAGYIGGKVVWRSPGVAA